MELEKRQYPIGKLKLKKQYSEKEIAKFIGILEKYPAKYKRATKKLGPQEWSKTYREGAWNVQQLVTHISDMHILHFARFKQALCMENPVGYVANINGWNELPEVASVPIADGLLLLEATHRRFVHLLKTMLPTDFDRTFHHPLRQEDLTLKQALHLTAWHTRHHLEHIKIALG